MTIKEPVRPEALDRREVGQFLKEAWRMVRAVARRYAETVDEPIPSLPDWETPESERPDDLWPGAHVREDGTVTFVLFAPMKASVALAGAFNSWKPEENPMAPTESGLWWVTIPLEPGRYQYQFVVDGDLWIADPYAREIDWDGTGPKGVVRVGERPYQWSDEGYHPRPLSDLIIYEVHVGDFTSEGTFEAMQGRLDYLQSLGVTALELMPVSEFPMDRSWGYNPAFYFAPESAYGPPEALKALIDEAHQRGMAVILDMVFNHTHQDSPLNRLWPYDQNPYFSGSNPWGMPDFNHYSDVTKTFVRDVQAFWLQEYHIDGFRYDATAYIESDQFNGIGFFTWAARQVNPHVYLIAEHLPQDPWWVHNSELDAQWHDTFHDVMKAQLREGVFEGGHQWGDLDGVERALSYAADGFGHPREVINYTASHDEERVVREALTNPHLTPEIAHRKARLAMTTVIGAAGVPMLYSGEEIGMERERSTGKVRFEWERLEQDGGAMALADHWRRLAWLRNTHPGLRAPGYETLAKYPEQKVIAFQRWDDQGDVLVVILNFSNEQFTLPVPFPQPGVWFEYLYDYAVEVGDSHVAQIEIGPSDGQIFCLRRNW